MTKDNTYRTILRTSSIMAGASVLNVVISLLRTKVVALLLGPAGVGLVGLYHNVLQVSGSVAGLGLGAAGIRRIADAHQNHLADELSLVRRAMLWATLALAIAGALAFYLLREPIARMILGDATRADALGWLAPGVAFIVAYGSQVANINGMRRIGDLARLQILSAMLATVLGLAAVFLAGEGGLLAYVLSASFASVALGQYFVGRIAPAQGRRPTPREMFACLRELFAVGLPYMASGLIVTGGFLVVRSLIEQRLGTAALGHFQAAWAIGMMYISFVLGSMGAEYYPRLSGCIRDHEAACALVNEQTEVALLLAAPLVIGGIAVSPWLIPLLYSQAFTPSVSILHWQFLGDIPKVASWPLSMVTLAAGAGKTYVLTECISIAIFITGVYFGLSALGLVGSGVAFLAMYLVYLPVVYWLARWRIGFHWRRAVAAQGAAFFAIAGGVSALSLWSQPIAAVVGVIMSGVVFLYGLGRLSAKVELQGPFGRLVRLAGRYLPWFARHGR